MAHLQSFASQDMAEVYLFGDQTHDVSTELLSLLHFSPYEPSLRSYFDGTYRELRSEVGNLLVLEQRAFPGFSSIPDLVTLFRRGRLPSAFDPAMTCMYQLGMVISKCSQTGQPYNPPSHSYLVGLCTGSIAAATVASCRTLSELVPAAIHAVRVAFRTGLCAMRAGRSLEAEKADGVDSRSWAIIVSGLPIDEAERLLADFSNQQQIPTTSQPYISVIGERSVSISGPPSVLHVLRESTLSQFRVVECPISSPFHSAKLFTAYDISQILEGTSAERWSNVVHLPVISSATGKLSAARTYRALLEEALEDMLLRPIIWEDVVYGVAYVNRLGKDSKISLRPVGTNAEAALCTALERKGFNAVVSSFKPVLNSRDQFLEEGNVPVKTPSGNSRIAIVGMSGRFPEADNLDEYWNILLQGLDVHKIVPPSRWSMNHVDPEGKRKNTSRTPFGCWLKQPGQFDATFFEISPREALQVDPASRIALMTTYEAMEQAGLVPDATPSTRRDRVGVFYGVTSNDWMEVNSSQKIDTYFIPGGCRAFIPGRVNYCFKFSGPSYSMDTACSSSLAAIHTACNSLWQGNVDTAIAGGTNVLTNPDYTAGLDKGHFLSRTGNCKPFDENADGYCRGEGVCTIILKRLEDALAENDPILGVISGAYTNHSAEAESITRPRAESQMAIFNKIMNDAGVLPEEVGYVEMHGTGTQAGDTVEMRSVLETFAPNYIGLSAENKPLRQPIYLGSAKANIGHGEASSGVSSLAKALLMLKNDIIPPHSGIKTKLNSRFPSDLQERNVHIASTAIAWPKAHRKPRRIFVNNFSAAGGNSALLIEDAPLTVSTRSTDTRSSHIVTVTAKSSDALWRNAESLANFLDGKTTESQITLPSLSYTTTARRIHHPHRLAVRGSSLQEIRSSLREELTRRGNSKGAPTGVTFAFTGNGTQYPGMGKQLFEAFPTFRADIMRLDQLLQSEGFPSVLPFCSQSSIEDLECPPVVVQLAAICLEIALARLWISWGVIPQAVIGHSLGEYAALNVAGVLSDSDTIYLVGKRASLLEQKCTTNTHSMLAVAAPQATVERLVKRSGCEVACINGPEDIVLSGPIDEIREMKSQLENKSIKATLLPVHYAFHSSQVDVILDEFEALCHGIKFQKPKIPVLSPLKGSIINNIGTFGPKYLSDHCRKPVNIVDTLRLARDRGLITKNSLVVEIGPQPIYGRMVRSTLGSAAMTVPSIKRNQDMWPILTGTLSSLYTSGVEINWGEYHRGFQSSLQVIPLPAYSWDLKDYWIQYVNDWSLRKGEPAGVTSDLPLVPVQGLGSSIHKIVEESIQGKSGAVILETDLSDRHIKDIATGHVVNDIPLATPAIYAEIALTLGNYLLKRYLPDWKDQLVEISDLIIEKALIPKNDGERHRLRSSATVDLAKGIVACQFATIVNQATIRHSHCSIRFTSKSQAVQAVVSNVQSAKHRMNALGATVETGESFRFNKAMIYRMVSSLAQFAAEYKSVDEIVLNSSTMEASSAVRFSGISHTDGTFHTHPAFIDALSQSAGFVMNANDHSDLSKEVFVNHGWKSFQLFESLSGSKKYRTFIRMEPKENKAWQGDLIVLDGDQPVASFCGITLQGVPRRLLHMILSQEQREQTGRAQEIQKSSIQATPRAPFQILPSFESGKPTLRPEQSMNCEPMSPKSELLVTIVDGSQRRELIEDVLRIISEETGVPRGDLTDNSEFSSIGIDSLMTLLIASKIQEELNLPIESSTFVNFLTIGDLKKHLEKDLGLPQASTRTDLTELLPAPVPINPNISAAILDGYDEMAFIASHKNNDVAEPMVEQALKILSEETGIPVAELDDDTQFTTIGVDSFLSIMLVSRWNEEISLDIQTHLFGKLSSVKELKRYIRDMSNGSILVEADGTEVLEQLSVVSETVGSSSIISENSSDRNLSSSRTSSVSVPDPINELPIAKNPVRPATSIILQGQPRAAAKILILFPDGSGSAASYSQLPPIRSDLAVIVLNSPYYQKPEEMECHSLDNLIDSYLIEIRRRQPWGPYSLGGWSSGGIFAYRAAQRLIQEGEEVEDLVLIDAPVPTRGLDRLPQRWYDACEAARIFGEPSDKSARQRLMKHFTATIEVLHDYHAEPLPEGFAPITSVIWASECVFDGVSLPTFPSRPEDPEGIKFLTEKRQDFSAGDWKSLFPGGQVTAEAMEGATHFSMMHEHAQRLAEFLHRVTR